MGLLDELGRKYKTDKSSLYHNYLDWYEEMFEKYMTESPEFVVEVGIKDGASLKMWRDYFPDSIVIGIDIENKKMIEGVKTYHFDATKPYNWFNNFSTISYFGLFIDDGSHITSQQMYTWEIIRDDFFEKDKSIFIMEDIHTSFIPHFVDTEVTTYEYLKNIKGYEVEFFQKDKEVFHDSMTAIIV